MEGRVLNWEYVMEEGKDGIMALAYKVFARKVRGPRK
jgi:hypothetical protein